MPDDIVHDMDHKADLQSAIELSQLVATYYASLITGHIPPHHAILLTAGFQSHLLDNEEPPIIPDDDNGVFFDG